MAPRTTLPVSSTVSLLLILVATAPAGSQSSDPEDSTTRPYFERLLAPSAPQHVYATGRSGERYLPEIMGGGGALLDYDRDGDLDLFLVQGGPLGPRVESSERASDQLFRNELQSGAPSSLAFTAARAGIAESQYGMGAASADFDNDGYPDLYVLNLGPNELWRNRGDGSFEAQGRDAGVDDPRWSTAASPADFDGDGWIDLYVVNYVDFEFHRHRQCPAPNSKPDYCGPLNFPPSADRLYRNLGVDESGQLRFEDITRAAGLLDADAGPGLGSLAADLDRDGRLDLYVANDQTANRFWLNLGATDKGTTRFIDEALLAGLAVNGSGEPEASMGIAASDFDRDGDLDLFLTHLREETNTLYVNDGQALFLDRTAMSGLATPSFPFTGFGTAWLDLENDGLLDLVVVNGAIKSIDAQREAGDPLPLRQRNQIFRQLPPAPTTVQDAVVRFEEVSHRGGPEFLAEAVSRGALRGDLDNDGSVDVVVVDLDEEVKVLRNANDSSKHWLGLQLVSAGGAQALGAMVRIELPSGPRTEQVRTDGSYLGAHDERVHFGTGSETAETATVLWPSGRVETFPVEADRYQTLREGKAPEAREQEP